MNHDDGNQDHDDGAGDGGLGDGEGDGEAPDGARRPGPDAAYARNWRTVLAVDALMGVAVLAAGVVLAIRWNPVGGGFVGSIGAAYVWLVVKRGRGWADVRREAGLG